MAKKNQNSRRNFLDKGLKIGLITAIGGIGLSKLNSKNTKLPGNKIKVMTTDGKLVEVDSSDVIFSHYALH